jgi:hypothetical protein
MAGLVMRADGQQSRAKDAFERRKGSSDPLGTGDLKRFMSHLLQ